MSQLDILQKRLIQKALNNEIAHFYLLRPHPQELEPETALKTWVEDLLLEVGKNERPGSELDKERFLQHPDFLIIENPKPNKAYQSSENPGLIEWAKTQDYGPMEFKRRWIIVHDAHTLTESFCHKQLKTLEEPNADTTLIFTDPQQTPMLQTIESRAIKIQMTSPLHSRELKKPETRASFVEYLKNLPENSQKAWPNELAEKISQSRVHEALECIKEKPENSRALLEWILDYERSRSNPRELTAVLKRMAWFERSQIHHNAANERWLTLLSPYFLTS